MGNRFLKISFLLGAFTVALGAFGAHALKEMLVERSLQTYQTAVLYQFIHLLALAVAGLLIKQHQSAWYVRAGYLFIAGIILFSGSLFALSFFKAFDVAKMNWLGAITPMGGLCFIAGWLSLFLGVRQSYAS